MKKISIVCVSFLIAFSLAMSSLHSEAVAQHGNAVLSKDVSFPKQFTLLEFFNLVSEASQTRFVAPGNEANDLTKKLNAAFANRQYKLKEVIEKYLAISGLAGYGEDSLSVIEAPFLGTSPDAEKINEQVEAQLKISSAALKLVSSLSKEQVEQMYAQGYVGVDWLTPEQRPIYVDFVRQTGLSYQLTKKESSALTDTDILAQPFKFYFSFTASFSVEEPGRGATSWIGLYDYGTGLIWNPLVPNSDSRVTTTHLLLREGKSFIRTVADEVQPSTKEVNFEKGQVLTARVVLDLIQKATGRKIVVDKRLAGNKLQQSKIVLSRGRYTIAELIKSVPATIGAELRPVGEILYLGQGDSLGRRRRQGQLAPQVEKAQQLLRRLPPLAGGIPFFSVMFDQRRVLPFLKLLDVQKIYIRERIKNELIPDYEKYDLNKSQVHFADTIWFSGVHGKPNEGPLLRVNVQIW